MWARSFEIGKWRDSENFVEENTQRKKRREKGWRRNEDYDWGIKALVGERGTEHEEILLSEQEDPDKQEGLEAESDLAKIDVDTIPRLDRKQKSLEISLASSGGRIPRVEPSGKRLILFLLSFLGILSIWSDILQEEWNWTEEKT